MDSKIIKLERVPGYRHIYDDVVEMFGEPRGNWLSLFGPHSCIWMISWRIITPVISALVFTFTLMREPLKIAIGATEYKFPAWATGYGWFLATAPLLAIPIIFIKNFIEFYKDGVPLKELFTIQPTLPSYYRIMGRTHRDNDSDQVSSRSDESDEDEVPPSKPTPTQLSEIKSRSNKSTPSNERLTVSTIS
ncbi:hypothetical protein GCK32_007684 [Trichostrongylus colubriformis]|uniref:Uncharacterized protein n=1 Tax=Trichostrongylus colubriformis TaxID=6319 RepID=A0AAN8FUI2_TRICO